jgi:hypothetical protein
MATDTTLVQGAYDANKYRGQAVDAAHRRLGDTLNEAVGNIAANKRKEEEAKKKEVDATKAKAEADEKAKLAKLDSDFSEASQKFLQSGSLDEGNYDATHDIVNAWRDDYINGDEKARGKIMNRMNNLSGDVATYKGSLEDVASMQEDGDFSNSVSPERKEWYSKLLNGEITMSSKQSEDEDGEQSYEMGVVDEYGNWMSQSALTNLLDGDALDNNSIETANNLGITQMKMGKEAKKDGKFDQGKVIGGINTMIKNGNINSLVHDEILGDGSGTFADHLRQEANLVGMTYADLGIDKSVAKKIGNGDDKVDSGELSQDDIDDIVKVFTTSPATKDALKDELKNYFVQYAKNQYNKGHEETHGVQESGSKINMTYSGK